MRTLSSTAATTVVVWATLARGLSTSDYESVFGSRPTNLTGSTTSLPQYDLTVAANNTHALFSYNATSTSCSSVGWLGLAIGTQMSDANYLIAWPNINTMSSSSTMSSAVSWTLSHRIPGAGGEVQPVVVTTDGTTATQFQLVPALTTSNTASPFCVVTYVRPLAFASSLSTTSYVPLQKVSTSFIYASSSQNPQSSAEDARLTQHNQGHAKTQVDLSAPISLDTSTGSPATTQPTPSTGRTHRDIVLIAHAAVGSIGILIFAPLAILIARWLRGSTWFPAHAAINVLAAALIIAAFGLGVSSVNGGHFQGSTHVTLGLVIFILVVVQVAGGMLAHRSKPDPTAAQTSRIPTLAGKTRGMTIIRPLHILLGIAIVVLGFIQVKEGFELWPQEYSLGTPVPRAVKIVYWVVLGVVAAAYVLGWAREIARPQYARRKSGSRDDQVGMIERK